MDMDHEEARARLRGRIDPDVQAHLDGCDACARVAAAERGLDEALARLPRHGAPAELVRRLDRSGAATEPALARPNPARRAALAAVVFVAAAGIVFFVTRPRPGTHATSVPYVREAVNDHLRVLAAVHPAEVEGGGIHQVRPWFAGRVDFAPAVAFGGDDDFPLTGGAVGYFVDRKCALFFFKRRLHQITLIVLPAAGIEWPERATATDRGYHVVMWRAADQAYALVSDVAVEELQELQKRI
jgi:anti-sigma factor RsiW